MGKAIRKRRMRLEERAKPTRAARNEGPGWLLIPEFDRFNMLTQRLVLNVSFSDCH